MLENTLPSIKDSHAHHFGNATLMAPVELSGIGIHTGMPSKVTIYPAPFESGYVFYRTDVKKHRKIYANYTNVCPGSMCTKVSNDYGVSILTVEHLLAALSGAEISNAIIEVDGPEVPILDGSSADFYLAFQQVGVTKDHLQEKYIKITSPIDVVADRNSAVSFVPSESRMITVHFDGFNRMDSLLTRKQLTYSYESFLTDIGFARTFGFFDDAKALYDSGYARGASLDNTIVIKNDTIMNEGGLRSSDEFIRHKILDVVGDLSLSGIRIVGHFIGINPGHKINNQLLKKVFETTEAWTLIDG